MNGALDPAAVDVEAVDTDAVDFDFGTDSETPPETGIMPDVDDGDVSQAAAIALITGAGLRSPKVSYQQSGSVPIGNVIAQSPPAGTEWPVDAQTSILVSKDPGQGQFSGSPLAWFQDWFYVR